MLRSNWSELYFQWSESIWKRKSNRIIRIHRIQILSWSMPLRYSCGKRWRRMIFPSFYMSSFASCFFMLNQVTQCGNSAVFIERYFEEKERKKGLIRLFLRYSAVRMSISKLQKRLGSTESIWKITEQGYWTKSSTSIVWSRILKTQMGRSRFGDYVMLIRKHGGVN